ncbi:hypothetical protein C8Q70DRAFT_936292 [Cubamyces menziesii]|nr:hypothetical protein C8Q70DRAFT_936292 [Cubamyces menziesii]
MSFYSMLTLSYEEVNVLIEFLAAQNTPEHLPVKEVFKCLVQEPIGKAKGLLPTRPHRSLVTSHIWFYCGKVCQAEEVSQVKHVPKSKRKCVRGIMWCIAKRTKGTMKLIRMIRRTCQHPVILVIVVWVEGNAALPHLNAEATFLNDFMQGPLMNSGDEACQQWIQDMAGIVMGNCLPDIHALTQLPTSLEVFPREM